MYEVGKKRLDGRYNVWRKWQVSTNYWDWIVDSIWDSYPDALEYASVKNRKSRKYKATQENDANS